jgi:hypothetical protein
MKSTNPVILNVIHHHPNPLNSTSTTILSKLVSEGLCHQECGRRDNTEEKLVYMNPPMWKGRRKYTEDTGFEKAITNSPSRV